MSRITVDLTGKVAFITGGGSGIGRGFGLQMAACGAAVIVTDLNGQAADRVAAEIVAAGGQALALPVDVADAAALDVAVAAGIARFGQIDFLFANAGVLGPADYLDITPDDWDLVMDVNIKGVALTCRAVA
ncbi:MAG: SDR family NAD(P)-dependent oxidoreductase, partial [Anaerolineae bacterium]|nr:SDR family NAD(P)-dependent oxidoreductase [Anaerolineae bacterium]